MIEQKSDRVVVAEDIVGELIGIDVDADPNKNYFHIKTEDGRNVEGKLADTFSKDTHWAVHETYAARVLKVTTIRYATGEEKIDWLLATLVPIARIPVLEPAPLS